MNAPYVIPNPVYSGPLGPELSWWGEFVSGHKYPRGAITHLDRSVYVNLKEQNDETPPGVYWDVYPIGESSGSMFWAGRWDVGTYYKGDVVLDWPYLMIANKETTDRPAPQPIGPAAYVYDGSSPTAAITAKTLVVGQDYTFPDAFFFNKYRVYTIAGNEYSTYYKINDGALVELLSFTAQATGWQVFEITDVLLPPGAALSMGVRIVEPDPTPTVFSGNWNYQTPNNEGIPAPGDIIHANRLPSSFRISTTDDDLGDRRAELLTMEIGDIIDGAGVRWSVQSITDNTTWFDFNVAPASQGTPDGVQNFDFETVTSTPITTMIDVDYWDTNPDVQGFFIIDSGIPTVTEDAYGVDIEVQLASVSPDWDLMAISGGSSGGGGVDEFKDLVDTPADYVDQKSKIPAVRVDEQGLEYVVQGVAVHSDQATYYFDDLVSHEGTVWHCISAEVTGPFSLTDWSPIAGAVGAGVQFTYRWDTSLSGDPGAGRFAISDPIANPTNTLRISELTDAGNNADAFWDTVQIGDYIAFVEDTGGAESGIWATTGPSVDQGTWYDIPVVWLSNTGEPENNRKGIVSLVQNPNDRLPAGGGAGQALVKTTSGDFDTEWADRVKNTGDTMTGQLTIDVSGQQIGLAVNRTDSGAVAIRIKTLDVGSGSCFIYFNDGDSVDDYFVRYNHSTDDMQFATGGIHRWNQVGGLGHWARMDYTTTTDLPDPLSIVTRIRGDARYTQTAQMSALLDLMETKGLITSGEKTALEA